MSDPSIRRAIDAVRAHDRPADVDRDALLRKILAASTPTTAAPSAAAKALPWIGAGVVALALLGALAWRSPREPVTARSAPVSVGGAPADPRGASAVPRGAPADPRGAPAVPGGASADPRGASAVPGGESVVLGGAPAVLGGASTALGGASTDRDRSMQGPAQGALAPSRVVAPTHRAPTSADEDEWRILREADVALRAREPDRALQILSRHPAQHPRGVATPEVMAYRVRAFCMAGRVDEARSVAAELRARAPVSPAAYSLRATCVSDR